MNAVDHLQHLIRIDMDAMNAYGQAIDNLDDQPLRQVLTGFRGDHERHIRDLDKAIRDLGGSVPPLPHLTGFALAGFTAIASGTHRIGCLMAMQSNEVVTSQAYHQALAADLPDPVRTLVERNAADEDRHLSAIKAELERVPAVGPALSGSATLQGAGASTWLNVVMKNPLTSAVAGGAAGLLLGAAGAGLWGRRRNARRRAL